MARRFSILALALLLAVAPLAARAQSPAAPLPADQNDIDHFGTEYTETVMLGILGGGILMNAVIGGGRATLLGAMAGSSLASWLFITLQARHYVVQRAVPRSPR